MKCREFVVHPTVADWQQMRRRQAVIGLCIVLCTGWACWTVAPDCHTECVTEFETGAFYAIDTAWGQAAFNVEFQDDSRYLLIVSSLGDAADTHNIHLRADAVRSESGSAADPATQSAAVWASVVFPCSTVIPATKLAPFRPKRRYDLPSTPISPANREGNAVLVTAATSRTALADHITVASIDTSSQLPTTTVRSSVVKRTNGIQRDFFLHVTDGDFTDPKQYARVTSRVVGEGEHVRVYLDRQQQFEQLAAGVVDETIRLLDSEIIPNARRRLGEYRDIDGDGKFAVLITPWLGHLQGGRTSLGGFVRGSDFQKHMKAPLSNRCDMLYLNSNTHPGPRLQDLLSHEFAHAVCFSERLANTRKPSARPDEEDWLNEAIAHLSEDGWSNLDYRISRFLNAPGDYPLVVADYYSSGMWRNHGCRGATYLFLRWCVDQYGPGMLRQLIRNDRTGTGNLESVTGVPFAELYRRWSIALCRSTLTGCVPNSITTAKQQPSVEPRILLHSKSTYGDFTSMTLCGPLSEWGLAGPRHRTWNIDNGRHVLQLRGTASTFIELSASSLGGTRRIQVRGEPNCELQVSIVKMPAGGPRMYVDADWQPLAKTSKALSHSPADRLLRVRVSGDVSAAFDITMIACEQNRGETRIPQCMTAENLRRLEVRSPSTQDNRQAGKRDSTKTEPNSTKTVRTFLVPIRAIADDAPHLVVKVLSTDSLGRRSAAWTDVAAPQLDGIKLSMIAAGRND